MRALFVTLFLVGCHASNASTAPDAAPDAATAGSACVTCLSDKNCPGTVCAQFGGDSWCAPACGPASECAVDRACAVVTTFSGGQASVCVPRAGVGPCGVDLPPAMPADGGSGLCGALAPPGTNASCTCASASCDVNGCYGGWWCDTATHRCHPGPATGCPDGGVASGSVYDPSGDAPSGTIGANGGSVSRLYFAVVGDTRPAMNDDTAGYPTAIITKIWQQIQALKPSPSFAVSTGDYMFSAPWSGQSRLQLDLYLGARMAFTGPLFPTMGNHECTGMTASNCGLGNTDGETLSYKDYIAKMLAPIGQSRPWYAVQMAAPDASWNAKFLFVAGNAWSAEQGTWLEAAMSEATTYTFIVRHESASTYNAPGVPPSEAIMAKHPYTLAIVGHTHSYGHKGRQIIVGNGGAPLTGSASYGFAMLSQRKDGAIVIDMIDQASGLADPSFHFAVKADGSAAP